MAADSRARDYSRMHIHLTVNSAIRNVLRRRRNERRNVLTVGEDSEVNDAMVMTRHKVGLGTAIALAPVVAFMIVHARSLRGGQTRQKHIACEVLWSEWGEEPGWLEDIEEAEDEEGEG